MRWIENGFLHIEPRSVVGDSFLCAKRIIQRYKKWFPCFL